MPFNLDYHVHPGYSKDAADCTMYEYCRRAVEIGLFEICFTTHLEVDPVRRHLDWFVRIGGALKPMEDPSWLDEYFSEIEQVRSDFAGTGLTIKAGLEVGFDRGLERDIENFIKGFPFDYILGSVHCLEHHAISSLRESKLYFPGKSVKEVGGEYYATVKDAVVSGLFDCIGHIDLYCRYGVRFLGPQVRDLFVEYVDPVFEQMVKRNIGLEVNTSAMRRGLMEFHPGNRLLERAGNSGVKIFTVGSDAHRPEDLGYMTREAVELLKRMGLKTHVFTRRRPIPCDYKAMPGILSF